MTKKKSTRCVYRRSGYNSLSMCISNTMFVVLEPIKTLSIVKLCALKSEQNPAKNKITHCIDRSQGPNIALEIVLKKINRRILAHVMYHTLKVCNAFETQFLLF